MAPPGQGSKEQRGMGGVAEPEDSPGVVGNTVRGQSMFGDLTVENKLQRQTEDFSNIIISTKYQYSSEVGQEGGVVIDDDAGVS